jgi:hypothetical protein
VAATVEYFERHAIRRRSNTSKDRR